MINFPSQTVGNLFNGNEASLRLDFNPSDHNRFFAAFNYIRTNDNFGPFNASLSSARGFLSPQRQFFPNGQVSYIHTFSPTVLNEFRAGYTLNQTATLANVPGVPQAEFDDGSAGFGSYNGYPQFFKDHVYSYSDMVSVSHGNHNMKIGVDIRRNIENSEFNVGRPSYYFTDYLYFAMDAPYQANAGVDPGIISGQPPQLATNKRHWRNLEFGGYFQDDWKVSRRLTLNLGLRYDLYTRHVEENGLVTNFILGRARRMSTTCNPARGRSTMPACPVFPARKSCERCGRCGWRRCGPGGFTKPALSERAITTISVRASALPTTFSVMARRLCAAVSVCPTREPSTTRSRTPAGTLRSTPSTRPRVLWRAASLMLCTAPPPVASLWAHAYHQAHQPPLPGRHQPR